MFDELQKAVDLLESMQVDMMFWKKKETNEKTKEKLQKYENCIDVVIDYIEEFDMKFDEDDVEE